MSSPQSSTLPSPAPSLESQKAVTPDEPKISVSPLVIAFLVVQLPLWVAWFQFLYKRPHYEFFLLAIPAAIGIVWLRWRRASDLQLGTTLGVWIGVGIIAFCDFVAVMLHARMVIGVSFVAFFVTVVYALGGWRLVGRCWAGVALVVLSTPPPSGLDWSMVEGLRDLTTTLGSDTLNRLKVPHLREGNVLQVKSQRLFVEDACSGVNSLFSTLACILVYVGVFRRHWLIGVLLMISAVGWIILCNTLRVVMVALGVSDLGIDLSSEVPHTILGIETISNHTAVGMFTYLLALVLTACTEQLLLFFGRGRGVNPAPAPEGEREGPIPSISIEPGKGWAIVGGFALFTVAYIFLYPGDYRNPVNGDQDKLIAAAAKMDEKDLPSGEGSKGWQMFESRLSHGVAGSEFGEYSRHWNGTLRAPDQPPDQGATKVSASVDYPFPYWHDLTFCYRKVGWQQEAVENIPAPPELAKANEAPGASVDKKIRVAKFTQEAHLNGYLVFTQFDDRGRLMTTPPEVGDTMFSRRGSPLYMLRNGSAPAPVVFAPHCQVQVFLECGSEPSPEIKAEAMKLFEALCTKVQKRLADESR